MANELIRPDRTCSTSRAMSGVGFFQKLPNVEFFAQAGAEFADARLDLGAPLRQRIDPQQQFAAEVLLCRFRQTRRLADRQFQCLDHKLSVAN